MKRDKEEGEINQIPTSFGLHATIINYKGKVIALSSTHLKRYSETGQGVELLPDGVEFRQKVMEKFAEQEGIDLDNLPKQEAPPILQERGAAYIAKVWKAQS